jgi:hypothetical protein
MKEQGFYTLLPDYKYLILTLGGKHDDIKTRPIYCCIKDRTNPFIFWAIPTSDISHRTQGQITKIQNFCNLPSKDIRSCYYHIGHTDRPAIYKISNLMPITDSYTDYEYISKNSHLILKDPILISEIKRKALRILADEKRHPNKYEQHITAIYNYLINSNT